MCPADVGTLACAACTMPSHVGTLKLYVPCPVHVLQSVSQQLEDLLDSSSNLALSRLQQHKEEAARQREYVLQVERLQDDLMRSHERLHKLQQQQLQAEAQQQCSYAYIDQLHHKLGAAQAQLQCSQAQIQQLQQQLEEAQAQLQRQQQQ